MTIRKLPPEAHLDAARAAHVALNDEYAKPDGNRRQGYIAGLHQAINYGLKMAEVSALIDIRDAVREASTPRNSDGQYLA